MDENAKDMLIFFDTETTGFPKMNLKPNAPEQPRVVQLAAILTELDGTERASLNMIVNPLAPIPKVVSDIHGITDDIARRCGVHPKVAAIAFRGMMGRAGKIVAHNVGFDLFMEEIEFSRFGMAFEPPAQTACTMDMSTTILNLPPTDRMRASGRAGPKPPKMSEAYKHFTGRELEGAHDALNDVRACRDVYFAIVNGGGK